MKYNAGKQFGKNCGKILNGTEEIILNLLRILQGIGNRPSATKVPENSFQGLFLPEFLPIFILNLARAQSTWNWEKYRRLFEETL